MVTTSSTDWRTPHDMIASLRQVYVDLAEPGLRNKLITPNFFFSYVSPPTANGSKPSGGQDPLENDNIQSKPIALYLPGLDGYGISAARNQFDDLAKVFEFWRMTVLPGDRSSFTEIVNTITKFVLELSEENSRKVVLIGESCGGLFAAAVAIKLAKLQSNPLQGLVLVNPATSFDQTQWDVLVPLLSQLPANTISGHQEEKKLTPYGVIGSLTLFALIPDNKQKMKIVKSIADLPTVNVPPRSLAEQQEIFTAISESFKGTESRLPAELLRYRVTKWLDVGDSVVRGRLKNINVPTLIVVGEEDVLMPSLREGKRLQKTIQLSELLPVKERGHFVLDDSVNLTEAILYSKIDPLNWKNGKRKYDPILDWKPPSPEFIETTVQVLAKPIQEACSPVFFSTDTKGKVWRGITKFPAKKGPILIVGNHQLFAADLRLLFPELMQNGIYPRGLAHPISFAGTNISELLGRTPGIRKSPDVGQMQTGNFQELGAVEVTPRNFYRLMQANQTVILFPGGAREALTGNRSYPLFWPDKVDFVRTAAKFNATIVPLSAIGMADGATVLIKFEDLSRIVPRIPFLAEQTKNWSKTMGRSARYDSRNTTDLLADIVAPTIPARNYFLFGKPVDTSNIDHNDLDTCERVYQTIKHDVRRGLDDLLRARKKDPYANTPVRVAFERVTGKQAPTFPIGELETHSR